MAKIYLIRHAESIANTKGIYQGQTYDTKLSPLGEKQAEAVGRRLSAVPLDALITSPLMRTKQTAESIQKFQSKAIPLTIEPEIIETNHGEWEGVSKEEIAKRWPELYEQWLADPMTVIFPAGEAFSDTIGRVREWFESFHRMLAVNTSVAIVTHSNVIQILWAHLQKIDFSKLWESPIPQATSVTLIEAHSPAKIIFANDIRHLSGLESDIGTHAI